MSGFLVNPFVHGGGGDGATFDFATDGLDGWTSYSAGAGSVTWDLPASTLHGQRALRGTKITNGGHGVLLRDGSNTQDVTLRTRLYLTANNTNLQGGLAIRAIDAHNCVVARLIRAPSGGVYALNLMVLSGGAVTVNAGVNYAVALDAVYELEIIAAGVSVTLNLYSASDPNTPVASYSHSLAGASSGKWGVYVAYDDGAQAVFKNLNVVI